MVVALGRLIVAGMIFVMNVLLAQVVSAAPPKVFAIAQVQPNNVSEVANNPSNSILFFDVTAIEAGGASNVFNHDPMFSVWMGYEQMTGESSPGVATGDREEYSAITYNHANGTIYAMAYDGGLPASYNTITHQVEYSTDELGDNLGDFDLYRINYQAILKDFITNSRPRGTIYAPAAMPIDPYIESQLLNSNSPLFDGSVDGVAHNVPHPSGANTVFLANAIDKVGEVGRAQTPTSFFNYEIDFIDPETLVVLDGRTGYSSDEDHQIRLWKRVSSSAGAAQVAPYGPDQTYYTEADNNQGGYNGLSTESWESQILARLGMDSLSEEDSASEPQGWAMVRRQGVLGVWVADGERFDTGSGADDVAFFEIDLSGPQPTATRKALAGTPIPGLLQVDERPDLNTTTNDADIEFLRVDAAGNLVIFDTGFFDGMQEEGKAITVNIANYAGTQVTPLGGSFENATPYTVSSTMPISQGLGNDNDPDVTNTTRVAYDKGAGLIYIIDRDNGSFTEDLYVFNPATGQIVYAEVNHSFAQGGGPFDVGLFNAGTQIIFSRGDMNDDGNTTVDDLGVLAAAIADPTHGGAYSAAVGQEYFDLTGDLLLTSADMVELQLLLGILPGDFNGDGNVNLADYTVWRDNLGAATEAAIGYAGDGAAAVTLSDYAVWKQHFGESLSTLQAVGQTQVPESTTSCLLGGLLLAAGGRWIRRRS